MSDEPDPLPEATAAQDQSVEGRLERIEHLLHDVLEELRQMTGSAGHGRGLGH